MFPGRRTHAMALSGVQPMCGRHTPITVGREIPDASPLTTYLTLGFAELL